MSIIFVRLTHTGLLPDGRTNAASVAITDLDTGIEQQNRKVPVYVPVGGSIRVPLTSRSLFSLEQGEIQGFVDTGVLTAEVVFRLQGDTPVGYGLAAVNPNIERIGGILRMVVDNASLPGLVLGERLAVTGLSGGFVGLDGIYTILTVTKNQNLLGPSITEAIVEVTSTGADIAAVQLAGVSLTLIDGKVVMEMSSLNLSGGFANTSAYFADDVIVNGTVDPKSVTFTSILPGDAPDNSIFLNTSTNSLYWRDSVGLSTPIGSTLAVEDEGISVDPITTTVNFTGAGVTATQTAPNTVRVDIPGGGGGGGDWFADAIWIDGGTSVLPIDQDGTMGKPFSTFAAAIAAAVVKQDALPIGILPTQRAGTRQVFIVAGGIYDEAITMSRGDVFYEFLAVGPVTIGDGAAGNFGSTVPRDVTWLNNQAVEDADSGGPSARRPQLILGTLVDMGEGTSTHTAAAIAWDISGNLILTNPGGGAGSTTAELHLKNVRIRGNLDATGDWGIRNCYIYRTRIDGWTDGLNVGGLFFQVLEQTRIVGLATCNVICRVIDCEFNGGMTASSNGVDLPPSGFVNTTFFGTFTRAATANFICDVTTYDHFVANGASLAGGATIQIRDRGVLPLTVGAPVDSPLAGTTRFDAGTGTLYVFDGALWKSTILV